MKTARLLMTVLGATMMLGCATTSSDEVAASRPPARLALARGSGAPAAAAYDVEQRLTVKDLPAGARRVRVWFWLPSEETEQQVVDFAITSCPAPYRFVGDAVHGDRCVYTEIEPRTTESIVIEARSMVERHAVAPVDERTSAGALTVDHERLLAEHLRGDVPHMEVDARIRRIADEACGAEKGVLVQGRKLYDWVLENADHYSKGVVKQSAIGSQTYCLETGGGSCTDMHSLFIALCRARGIPARIVFGTRLKPENEGKAGDPGYRCWAYIFAPRLGWLPVDVAAGDTNPDKKDLYFGGLDDRRLSFVNGRDLVLSPHQDGMRLNYVNRMAWIEVDGQPHAKFDVSLTYRRL